MPVITRFAPSPTGMLHIGNARTAMFSWLYARHHGGKCLLRIEDTDRERSTQDAIDAIFEAIEWLGLDWDGDPVYQTNNIERHKEIVQQLLNEGKAYKCYCTPEDLDHMREQAKSQGRAVAYDRRWRDKDPTEAPKGLDPVVRIKAPLDGSLTIKDLVQGDVTVESEQLDDFILLRADGTPTYMLAVVVDDHDMGITHIIRGDDHLNNALRQKVIYDALGWDVPSFAHIPMILGADGSKLGKRHGALGVRDYRDMGYLPETLFNMLLRLGWGHGDDEIISKTQAIEWFDLNGVGKAPSRFDLDKLNHLNTHYMKESDNARLLELMNAFFPSPPNETVRGWILACLDELKTRAKTLKDLAQGASFLFKETPLVYDSTAQNILDKNARAMMSKLITILETVDPFQADAIQEAVKNFAKNEALKMGDVAMPLRVALTGVTQTPSVFLIAEVFGQAETLKRLKHAAQG